MNPWSTFWCLLIPLCLHLHWNLDLFICYSYSLLQGFPESSAGKESTCNAGDTRLIPGLEPPSWRRAWQSALVSLPGESHGQRSLLGYSPWGCRDSDNWGAKCSTQHLGIWRISVERKENCEELISPVVLLYTPMFFLLTILTTCISV